MWSKEELDYDSNNDSEDKQLLYGEEKDYEKENDEILKVNNGKRKLAPNGENHNKIIKEFFFKKIYNNTFDL